jgi:hypothetical protein
MKRPGVLLAISVAVVVALIGVAAQRVAAAPAWAIQPTPNPGAERGDYFTVDDVSCTNGSACAAVGQHVSRQVGRPFIERWNGSSWVAETLPIPAGDRSGHLYGVSCPAADACTAVGITSLAGYAGNTTLMLAAHWDGKQWSEQRIPIHPGSVSDDAFDVSCAAPTSCIAVGYYYYDMAGDFASLAERWNGTRWDVLTTPNPPGGGYFTSVACTAVAACVAVGVWFDDTGTPVPFAERWDGSSWTIAPMPAPAGAHQTIVNNVSCSSTSACTAVGWTLDAGGVWAALAERWDGTAWALQSPPAITGSTLAYLEDVSCPDANVCVATGFSRDGAGTDVTLVERWDGTAWTVQSSPNPIAGGSSHLDAVDCVAIDVCVAAGDFHNLAGPRHTLVEMYG